jgi:tetratricopeptide (TPR) repeat protein
MPSAPEGERFWVALIEGSLARGASKKALESALSATEAIPSSQRLRALLGLSLLSHGEFAEAIVTIERLWSCNPSELMTLTVIGQVAAAVERHDLARAAFERALVRQPDDPQLQFNLATSLRNFGELAGAERLYDNVIRRRPDDWEAYQNRAELRRQSLERNHIAEIESAIIRAGADWRGAVMLHYALGKEREDLGRHDDAFAAYDNGAKLRRRHMQYSVDSDLERLQHIRRVFSAEWLRYRGEGCKTPEPIFIIGLPRSGSTLLERMLGAHPDVVAAGELQNFGICTVRLANGDQQPKDQDVIRASARLDPRQLGEAYLTSTRPKTGHVARFIDKLPANFLYAGLIAAALPNAAIIHIHRDPRDNGFGMYKTLFKQAYPFSYDLREIGRYIRGYQELMEHWLELFPGRIVDVVYEELVNDSEKVVSAVLERCRLSFDPACMSFYNRQDATSTASAVQVRQPIYRTSVGAWRRYARHLGSLLEELPDPRSC